MRQLIRSLGRSGYTPWQAASSIEIRPDIFYRTMVFILWEYTNNVYSLPRKRCTIWSRQLLVFDKGLRVFKLSKISTSLTVSWFLGENLFIRTPTVHGQALQTVHVHQTIYLNLALVRQLLAGQGDSILRTDFATCMTATLSALHSRSTLTLDSPCS